MMMARAAANHPGQATLGERRPPEEEALPPAVRRQRGRTHRRALHGLLLLALVLLLALHVLAARAHQPSRHRGRAPSPLSARGAAHRQRRRALLSSSASASAARAPPPAESSPSSRSSSSLADDEPAATERMAAPSSASVTTTLSRDEEADDTASSSGNFSSKQQQQQQLLLAASPPPPTPTQADAGAATPTGRLAAMLKRAYDATVARRDAFAAISKSVRTTVAQQEEQEREEQQQQGQEQQQPVASAPPPPPPPPQPLFKKRDLFQGVAARVQKLKQAGDTMVLQRSLEQQLRKQWEEDNNRAQGGLLAAAAAANPDHSDDDDHRHHHHHHPPGERCSTQGPSGQRLALVLEQAEQEQRRQLEEDADDARRRGPLWRLRAAAHAMRTGGREAREALLRRLDALDKQEEEEEQQQQQQALFLSSSNLRLAEEEEQEQQQQQQQQQDYHPPAPTLRKTKRVRTRRDAAADAKESSPSSPGLAAALPPSSASGASSDEEPSPPPTWFPGSSAEGQQEQHQQQQQQQQQEDDQQQAPPPPPPPLPPLLPPPSWGSVSNPTFNTGPDKASSKPPTPNRNGNGDAADGSLPPAPVRVPLHVHVIVAGPNGPASPSHASLSPFGGLSSSSGLAGNGGAVPRSPDDVPLSRVRAQVDALNHHFGAHDIRFALQLPINVVTDPVWAAVRLGSPEEAQMKATLRKGGAESMNLYVVHPADGILGWSTFPFDHASNPSADGVVILHDTMPGGQAAPYNLGMTAVHETGHWMGLFHPWQGGCNGGVATGGDGVADTPPARRAAYGCPAAGSVNTCATGFGADATSNAMGYVDDRCMTDGFTKGQGARMRVMWRAYRRTAAARALERRALSGEPLEAMSGWWREEEEMERQQQEQQSQEQGQEEKQEEEEEEVEEGRLLPESAPVRPAAASPKMPSPPAAAVAPLYRAGGSLKGMSRAAGGSVSGPPSAAALAAVASSGLFDGGSNGGVGSAAAPSSPSAAELTRLLRQHFAAARPADGKAALATAIFGAGGGAAGGGVATDTMLAMASPSSFAAPSFNDEEAGGGAAIFAPEQPLGAAMMMPSRVPLAPKSALQLTREMPGMLSSMYGRGY
jgi:hypothetical protein